jgi:drug/metabolite transporter (DMT)-like permease
MTSALDVRTKRSIPLAIAAMVLSAACWGCATVMTKGALDQVPPFTLLALQLASGVTFLWVAAAVMRTTIVLEPGTGRAAATGLLEPGLSYGLGVPGLALTTAANASIIGAAEPALIILVAWAFFRHRPSGRLALAVLIAMIGIILVTLSDLDSPGHGDLRGDLLVLLGTAFAALYVVSSSRFVTQIAPLPLAALQQSVGLAAALVLLAGALLIGGERLPVAISPDMLLLAAASGIVQYALAFWLYLIGLKVLSPGVAGLFLALIPVFGIGGAAVFLGESLMVLQGAGVVLVIVAVIVVTRRPI